MAVKVFQLHKRASYEYKFIQDKYAVDVVNQCYAIADGTTQSFNSEEWAGLLTQSFKTKPDFDPDKIVVAFKACAEEFTNKEFAFSANPAKASLEREKLKRGATATFLGIQIDDDRNVNIVSVGDSNLFIVNPDGTKAFPFESIELLDKNQDFLNTQQILNGEIETQAFKQAYVSIQEDSILILATDALSRLFLKYPELINKLLLTEDFEQFLKLCLTEWEGKQLEEDDITALVIYNFSSDQVVEVIPPSDFSFPKEKKNDFIPSFAIQQTNELSEPEMQNLSNSVNQLNQELHQVKQSTKSQQSLLIILGCLVFINTLLLVYFVVLKPASGIDQNDLVEAQKIEIENLRAQLSLAKTTSPDQKYKVEVSNPEISTSDSITSTPALEPSEKTKIATPTAKRVTLTKNSKADDTSLNKPEAEKPTDKGATEKPQPKVETEKQTSSTQIKE